MSCTVEPGAEVMSSLWREGCGGGVGDMARINLASRRKKAEQSDHHITPRWGD